MDNLSILDNFNNIKSIQDSIRKGKTIKQIKESRKINY